MNIDAEGLHYRDLNEQIHAALSGGDGSIALTNVRGHRYIGVGLDNRMRLVIEGVPGNDLAAFMNGADITVHGNVQDGVGNTMNAGKVVVHGDAGDILGHSMRGGKILVRGNVGWRAGIHMKAYGDHFPVVVVGGTAGDYLGEYMAGGILAVLNLDGKAASPVGRYVGTGMHGGVIYLRGDVSSSQLGLEVGTFPLEPADWKTFSTVLAEYCETFGLDAAAFSADDFIKLTPKSIRPYGKLYAY